MMQKLIPCLWFDGHAEEASHFYVSLFDPSKIVQVSHYGEAASEASGQPQAQVMTVSFELGRQKFLALNGGPQFTITPAISFFIHFTSEEEMDALWGRFAEGGEVLMPLDHYPFAKKYGWVQDRFGVSWQLILMESAQKFVPCFLFVNDQSGRAEEAMNFYRSHFTESDPVSVDRYGPEGPGVEGTIAYARFRLAGQEFIVMDAPGQHQFTFSPGISIIVNCESQEEIDSLWEKLSEGGQTGRCGWLKDRFGVSWQIVPSKLEQLMARGSAEQSERVMKALLGMNKLDLARLEDAAEKG